MTTKSTARVLPLLVLCLSLLVTGKAQDAVTQTPAKPSFQPWEYRFVETPDLRMEMARKLGWTKNTKDGEIIDDTKMFVGIIQQRKEINQFMLDRFNELGAEGWQFSGCLGKEDDTLVFRRPK